MSTTTVTQTLPRLRRPLPVPGGQTSALLALLLVTAVWGSTFPLLKGVLPHVPAADFLAVRFALATVVLVAIRPRALGTLSRRAVRNGVLLGLVFGAAQLLQTFGLEHTSASVSGFISGMYVVIVPLMVASTTRRRVPGTVWAAVALAAAGLGVLALRGLTVGGGEAMTLAAAALYALHIVGLGRWSTARDAYALTVVQAGVTTLVTGLAALPSGIALPSGAPQWAGLVYLAVVAGAATMVAQTWAQARLDASRAAVVMTLEPVWAGAFAVALAGEALSWRLAVGGPLVLGAMLLVERPDAGPALLRRIRALVPFEPQWHRAVIFEPTREADPRSEFCTAA